MIKRRGSRLLGWILVTVLVLGGPAHAVEVENLDSQRYEVWVESVDKKRLLQLDIDMVTHVICAQRCRFWGPGIGEVRATRTDRVVLVDGQLKRWEGTIR